MRTKVGDIVRICKDQVPNFKAYVEPYNTKVKCIKNNQVLVFNGYGMKYYSSWILVKQVKQK